MRVMGTVLVAQTSSDVAEKWKDGIIQTVTGRVHRGGMGMAERSMIIIGAGSGRFIRRLLRADERLLHPYFRAPYRAGRAVHRLAKEGLYHGWLHPLADVLPAGFGFSADVR